MSKIENIIVLDDPEILRYSQDGTVSREMIERRGFTCPHCHGAGQVVTEGRLGELIKAQCPICLGFGTLKARVVIEWMPDERNMKY